MYTITRTLTLECVKYESMLHTILKEYSEKIELKYDIKRWVDNTITVDVLRADLRNEDGDDIYMRIEGNYDIVYSAIEGWLESEVNR